jgi:hypothetical protein
MPRPKRLTRARGLSRAFAVLAAAGLAAAGPASAAPTIAGCPVFPDDNVWNTRVDTLPVHPRSADYIATIGADVGLHPDFGSGTFDGGPIGIPVTLVPATQPRVAVAFDFADESDPGPYPIPPDALIEGGPQSDGDRHVLVVDRDACVLYELFAAFPQPDGSWTAGSGAVFDLRSNALRPAGFTSADAAGLPILAGLARFDEVASGEIRHALRFTARLTQDAFVWPARHEASSNPDPAVPPMGQRFRLKAAFDVSPFPPEVQVILRALQRYGLILADNGSNWFISGVPDPRWNDDVLVSALRQIRGSDFEAVDVSSLIVDPDSGQAQAGGAAAPAITAPASGTRFLLVPDATTPLTLGWTAVAGVTQYLLEVAKPNLGFSNPNGTGLDPVNGAGSVAVTGTTVTAALTPLVPPASYQVRVIGLSAAGQPTGAFSDAVTVILALAPAPAPPGQATMTAPASGATIARGQAVTLGWTVVPGAAQYLLEVTGPGRQFANPNGTDTDPVNGAGGAGAGVALAATNVTVTIPLEVAPATYQVRVLGLSETSQAIGRFSDALTLTIQ